MGKTKSRGNGEGTIYHNKSRGFWAGQVVVGKKSDGSFNRKTIYGKSREDVKNKMVKIQSELNTNTYIEDSKISLQDYVKIYLDTYEKPKIKESTYLSYIYMFNKHIKNDIGLTKIQNLTNSKFQEFINIKHDSGLKEDSLKRLKIIVNGALKKAVLNKIIYSNPLLEINIPKDQNTDNHIKSFSLEQQKNFCIALENEGLKNLFLLNLCTGCRIGELLALKAEDINYTEKYISINKTLFIGRENGKLKIKVGIPKTKYSIRKIPFLNNAENVLKSININEGYLFTTSKGTLYNSRNIARSFERICLKADNDINEKLKGDPENEDFKKQIIGKANVHMLRHTFATRCLEAGMNIKVVSKILGHSNIKITLDIYSHVLEKFENEEVNKVDDYLKLNNLFF